MHRPLLEHAARDIRQDGHPQSHRARHRRGEIRVLDMESSDIDALVRQFKRLLLKTITYYYETSLFI